MHADVCSLAMDKKTNLIILPFHRQRNIDGILESSNSIRNLNQQVLRMAPCTVAVLVERGNSGGGSQCVLGGKPLYRVAVVFMGGGDDREALVLAGRMAEHSSIQLTVVRLVVRGDGEKEEEEMRRDEGVVNEFRVRSCVEGRVEYREEEIRDGEDTIRVVRGLEEEGEYELVVVGRQHGVGGMRGLRDWNEFPELGFIGDMLASSEREGEGAVLVVQHEMLEEEEEVMPVTGDKANFAGV